MNRHRGVWLFLLVLGAFAACRSQPEEPATSDAPAAFPATVLDETVGFEDEPVVDGKYLYSRNCAGCHNENGDGLGATILELGLVARSFAEGNFAFGNTRESILRTISSGIPGSSVMPAFAGILSKEQCELVVDYVMTLMPAQPADDPKAGLMHVVDQPVIVRGSLPAIVEGAPRQPRGLLIGLPEGLTLEYRTDDVRLLGVRLGDFVDRRDWGDRGGATLEPLGRLVYAMAGGNPSPCFGLPSADAIVPAHCKLRSTSLHDHVFGTQLSYYVECTGALGLDVIESVRATRSSLGVGFTRTFTMGHPGKPTKLTLDVAGRGANYAWVSGPLASVTDSTGQSTASIPADGWLALEKEGAGCDYVHVRAPEGTRLVPADGIVRLLVEMPNDRPTQIAVTVIVADKFTPEGLVTVKQEVSQ